MIINLNLNENKNYLIKFIKKKFKSENFEVIFIYIHYMFTSLFMILFKVLLIKFNMI